MEKLRTTVLRELERFILPLRVAALSKRNFRRFLNRAGWEPEALDGAGAELLTALVEVTGSIRDLVGRLRQRPDNLLTLVEDLARIGEDLARIGRLSGDFHDLELDPEDLRRDLFDLLVFDYLAAYHPRWLAALFNLALVEPASSTEEPAIVSQNGRVLRLSSPLPRLRLDRLSDLLSDPLATLEEVYLPGGKLATSAEKKAFSDRLFPRLGVLVEELGCGWQYGIDGDFDYRLGPGAQEIAERLFEMRYELLGGLEVGTLVWLSPATPQDLGLLVAPFGTLELDEPIGDWQLRITASGDLEGVAIRRDGVRFGQEGENRLSIDLELARVPEEEGGAAFLFGAEEGTHLRLGTFRVRSFLRLAEDQRDYGLSLHAGQSALVIAPRDGDGFLSRVLPAEGVEVEFDLGLGWSRQRGVYLEGGAGLEATVPVDKQLGPVDLQAIRLSVRPDEGKIPVGIGLVGSLALGPFTLTLEGVGLAVDLEFPDSGGNLGVVDLGLAFKPPTGVGIAVDSETFTGGGFLYLDHEKGEYAGVVHLEFEKLALTAVGILTTRMPDGSDGWSLFLSISAKFPAIQLGFGFTLDRVGGLIGLHRDLAVPALQSGLRAGALESVLFPDDPVANAPQILSAMQLYFPPAADRFVFGPVARVGWGTPTLIVADVGVVLVVPDPVRLVLIGRMEALLPPEQERPLVELRLDVLGVVDFAERTLAIDATLRDSRIQQFAVSGDMSLRAAFGDRPDFALAVGGFHPAYVPPANFPALRRMTVSLDKDKVRVRLTSYFALTSNTVQFGAALDLRARALSFDVEGGAHLDVLVRFSPFGIVADLGFYVAVRKGSKKLASVGLDLHLSGPGPWRAVGTATVKLLFFKGTLRVAATIGPSRREEPPGKIDVRARVREALEDPGNWTVTDRGDTAAAVRLRELDGEDGEPWVLPASRVEVRQKVVPLGVPIERFGHLVPDGPRRFELVEPRIAGRVLDEAAEVEEWFAPADFFAMSDHERLTAPAFELHGAGLAFGDAGAAAAGARRRVRPAYEETCWDPGLGDDGPKPSGEDPVALAPEALEADLRRAAFDRFDQPGRDRFVDPRTLPAVALEEPRFDLVRSGTGRRLRTGRYFDLHWRLPGARRREIRPRGEETA